MVNRVLPDNRDHRELAGLPGSLVLWVQQGLQARSELLAYQGLMALPVPLDPVVRRVMLALREPRDRPGPQALLGPPVYLV